MFNPSSFVKPDDNISGGPNTCSGFKRIVCTVLICERNGEE